MKFICMNLFVEVEMEQRLLPEDIAKVQPKLQISFTPRRQTFVEKKVFAYACFKACKRESVHSRTYNNFQVKSVVVPTLD